MSGPVFVAGLERTGTSLMYALLASHPDIAMTRRTNLWPYFYRRYGDLADDANLDRCVGVMQRYKRLHVLGIDWDRLRADFVVEERSYPRLFELLERQVADQAGKPRWGDKSLHTERYADLILAAYPDATILHMMRDPRDRFASVMARWKSRRGGVGAGIAEWDVSSNLAVENGQRHPDRYRVVRYEDLVRDPEREMRSVCEAIGAPFDPAMLEMRGAPEFREQGANSSYGPRRAGVISADSIGKYAAVLPLRQVRFIEERLAATMDAFGYERTVTGAGGLGYVLRTYGPEMVRFGAWNLRHRWRSWRGLDVPDYRLLDKELAS